MALFPGKLFNVRCFYIRQQKKIVLDSGVFTTMGKIDAS
jgi:hypothetical protein